MCGVIGFYTPGEITGQQLRLVESLLGESRIRGRHAYGFATGVPGGVGRAEKFVGTFERPYLAAMSSPFIAHTRYSTSGDWKQAENNQPILAAGAALVFNGVIHQGTKVEMEKEFSMELETENDGEVMLQMIVRGEDWKTMLKKQEASFAGLWIKNGILYGFRNEKRPLWIARAHGAIFIASTKDIFNRVTKSWEELFQAKAGHVFEVGPNAC